MVGQISALVGESSQTLDEARSGRNQCKRETNSIVAFIIFAEIGDGC
jgi:hypothetical protein